MGKHLAEESRICVDGVRALFVLATLFLAGAFALVAIVQAFALPVADPSLPVADRQEPVG